MKKFLLILSGLSLITSSLGSTMSISYNNNFNEAQNKMIKLHSEVSAYALRSAILYDINQINDSFTTPYYNNTKVSNVMPELIQQDNNPLVGIDKTARMDQLNALVFNINKYSFRSDIKNAEVKQNTNLDIAQKLKNEQEGVDEVDLRAPDTNTGSTVTMISGLLTTLFGSGINSQTIAMIISFLNQPMIQDLIVNDDVKNVIDQVNNFLDFETNPENGKAMEKILDAVTEKKVAVGKTFSEVLSEDLNNLYKGLTILVHKKTILEDKDVKWNEIFFDLISGTINKDDEAALKKHNLIDVQEHHTIESISYIVKFVNSLFRYVAKFDKYRVQNLRDQGNNNIFDVKKDNKEVVKEVLTSFYKPGKNDENDHTWFKKQNGEEIEYYSVINLKDVVANLYYYFAVDEENDPNGINFRKFLYIMFGEASGEVRNPLADLIINQGIGRLLGGFITKMVGDIEFEGNSSLEMIATIISSNAKTFNELVGDFTRWILSKFINNDSLAPFINTLNLIVMLGGDAVPENIKAIIKDVVKYFGDPKRGETYKYQPYKGIYNGTLLPDLIELLNPVLKDTIDLSAIASLKNIKTILTTDLASILRTFGVSDLPDIFYIFNKKSLNDIIQELAWSYGLIEVDDQTNKVTKVHPFEEKYLDEFLNTQDLENIVNNLTSKNSGIYKNDKQINVVLPFFYALVAGNKELDPNKEDDKKILDILENVIVKRRVKDPSDKTKTIEINHSILIDANNPVKPGSKIVNANTLNYILGLDPANLEFIENTLLYNLSRMYGENYSQEEYDLNKHLVGDNIDKNHRFGQMKKAMSSIFTKIIPFVGGLVSDSIDYVIEDKYFKYLKEDNFKITDLTTEGFEFNQKTKGQKLQYNLSYYDPDSDKTYTYHVLFTKGYIENYQPNHDEHRGFVLRKLIRQN